MILRSSFLFMMTLTAANANALDQRILKELMALSPEERLEQRCDVEAMDRIKREAKGFRPDKVIAYTFGDPVVQGNSLKASGAVFRSGGEWYRLKFKCETGPEHVEVRSFDFKIGSVVPKSDWDHLYLYD